MKQLICLLSFGLLLTSACSVREDRSGCPCRLELDLQTFSGFADRVTVSVWEGTAAGQETVRTDSIHVRALPKGVFEVSVWTGADAGRIDGTRLVLPPDGRPDSLRLFRTRLDCRREVCREQAEPFRQFARIRLEIETEPGTAFPYRLRVESDYCGLDLRDLRPIPGGHTFALPQLGEGHYVFDLLRHGADTRVRLSVWEEREHIAFLPLNEWLRAAGYDWEAPDLAPVRLTLDYGRSIVRIHMEGWQEGEAVEARL